MSTRVLVANRGEIAVRVLRAARELGWATTAVYAADDAGAAHVGLADDARPQPGAGPAAYLDVDALVAAGVETGCTLVHPGYGFRSESAEFARACAAAGLTFVGPEPDVLDRLGDKTSARALAADLGIPVAAGGSTLAEAEKLLEKHGAVIVKAVAGGGGLGMRVVRDAGQLADAYERCRSEARSAFGREDVYVEQYLAAARHVEVQVVGDGTGAVVAIGDRDCSVQRRHQKLVEVAPAPALPPAVRAALADAATRLTAAVGFRGLATVEFLVDADALTAGAPEPFAFLEVNPRLQVEHTVTEEVHRVDLVAAQLRIAAGATLDDVGLATPPPPVGCAIQARVNAESYRPDGSPTPSTGTLTTVTLPGGPGVRVDTAARVGDAVSARFDSLLAKVVVSAPDGPGGTLRRLERALAETRLDGVATNLPALAAIVAHPAFRDGLAAGTVTTGFLADHPDVLRAASAAETVTTADTQPGTVPATADLRGVVAAVRAEVGRSVRAGEELVVVEAMKMEHVVAAPVDGTVVAVPVAAGDPVVEGAVVAVVLPGDAGEDAAVEAADHDPDAIRSDLADVLGRQALLQDAARPEAVAKRHARGRRTARENLADLVEPGTWVEYGGLVVAAQRTRRSLDELVAKTPADGVVAGLGRINGDLFADDRAQAAVLSYDYTVLAGTQGMAGHKKKDRLFEVIERLRRPVVLFAEGGGGRPGDVDVQTVSGLDTQAFTLWAGLSGLVPRIAVVSGRCFAGNAALAGCSDLIIGTRDASLGMGGPAMIEGGGLGVVAPDEVGPAAVQAANGVLDVLVDDDAAAVAAAKQALSYFQGALPSGDAVDQRLLRQAIPENRLRVYDVRRIVEGLCDTGSVLELRSGFAPGMVTALARIDGRPVGVLANNPLHLAGAITSDGADKAARFLQLCEAHRLPVISLVDTPGMMVGPDAEKTALVRHCSRLFVVGAALTVPLVAVVLRKAYGLGAQAMTGGSLLNPLLTVAWPTGELGAMGFEGAVRLGARKELEAIADPVERQQFFEAAVAALYERGKALSAATYGELDDVVDPADTRRLILTVLRSAHPGEHRRGFVDVW
ncbi:acetyl-CoA carboxylase family protein [Cryptosporangium minutisporangium]|uniref:Carboxyl transferase domain-containing protein n=1 Tax=Cryptosporangium minutisporangium TaxID=113569 RepID=A0ABP6T5W6_9ACTN